MSHLVILFVVLSHVTLYFNKYVMASTFYISVKFLDSNIYTTIKNSGLTTIKFKHF